MKLKKITFFNMLEEFKKRIEELPNGYKEDELFKIMEEFHSFLTKFDEENLFEVVQKSEKYKEYKDFFREKNNYFMRVVETVDALDIIVKNIKSDTSLSDLFSTKFLQEIFLNKEKELAPLNMKEAKKMIFVGSGPLPHSCLYVYKNTNIPTLIGLDYNEDAIKISSQLVKVLDFDNRIKFKYIDATTYDYKDADIVYIAGFVPKKDEVLAQVANTSISPHIQILVDATPGINKILFEDVNENNLDERLKIESINLKKTDMLLWKTIKLVKRDI